MPTYFKPLRRKIGVVTLMIACLMMSAWFMMYAWLINLNGYQEYVFRKADEPPFVRFRTHGSVIATTTHKLILCHVRNDSGFDLIGPFYVASPVDPIGVINAGVIFATEIPVERERKFCGFELTKRAKMSVVDHKPVEITSIAIPYMAVVLPLALLSAWLLLSKPRAGKTGLFV